MLLLVLILVLIAFALLVVALLTGSVLWAWVSVAVSVAAAVVLLVDWLQRRSAVTTGADVATGASGGGDEPRTPVPVTDHDPVTEVLPVIPPSDTGASPDVSEPRFDRAADAQQTVVMPVVQPSGSTDRPSGATSAVTASEGESSLSVTKSGAEPPFAHPVSSGSSSVAPGTGSDPDGPPPVSGPVEGRGPDSEATVVVRAHTPADRTSAPDRADSDGAAVDGSAMDGTAMDDTGMDGTAMDDTGMDDTGMDDTGMDGTGMDGTAADDTVVTASVQPRSNPAADAPIRVSGSNGGPRSSDAPNTGTADGRGPEARGPEPTGAGFGRLDPEVAADGSATGAPGSRSAGASAAVTGATAADHAPSVVTDAGRANGADPGSAAPPSVREEPPEVEKPPTGHLTGAGDPADAAPVRSGDSGFPGSGLFDDRGSALAAGATPPPAAAPVDGVPDTAKDRADRARAAPADVPAPEQGTQEQGTQEQGTPEQGEEQADRYDGEPPEEPHQAGVAAIVAGLDDEVVVVDEQPRYHVPECASLAGKSLIALPAREAVELGFTPCGWCSPDATLAGRHPAPAR